MKKVLMLLLALSLCIFSFSGCEKKAEDVSDVEEVNGEAGEENEAILPFDAALDFYFSSGAGAWGTELVLKNDGSFEGYFHDTNMGEAGENNPNGTTYVCDFSGKFESIEKIDETSYRMKLSYITTEKEEGEEWIEDGILYVTSYPYGLSGGTEFIFYTPETKTDSVAEEFLWWWPERFIEDVPETLMHYGIHNVDTDDGFFTY